MHYRFSPESEEVKVGHRHREGGAPPIFSRELGHREVGLGGHRHPCPVTSRWNLTVGRGTAVSGALAKKGIFGATALFAWEL